MLACPSGELHDLGLICFGIALRGHGWRITYLGADTPQPTLVETAARLPPNIVAELGAVLLDVDPVTAAARVAAEMS